MRKENLSKEDVEVLNVTSDLKTLTMKKTKLVIETGNLDKNISKLVEDQLGHENRAKETIYKANQEAERIMAEASVLYEKSQDREKEYNEKIGGINKKEQAADALMKKAEDIIKSNEGLKKNLEVDSNILTMKLKKFNQFLEDTSNALKTI